MPDVTQIKVCPGTKSGATPKTNHHHEVEYAKFTASECRCGDGECVCDFYIDWDIIWPSRCDEPIGAQLRRRRSASWRCPRLDSGHRDPMSASRW